MTEKVNCLDKLMDLTTECLEKQNKAHDEALQAKIARGEITQEEVDAWDALSWEEMQRRFDHALLMRYRPA